MTISLKADAGGTFGEVLINGSPALKVSPTLLELPDGKDFFNQGNIVGTVSQSDGIPTGAVVERGSNANGEYIRFADGTQICRMLVAPMSATEDTIWTFPAVFFSSDMFVHGMTNGSGTTLAYLLGLGNPSGSSTPVRNFLINTAGSITRSTAGVRVVAIGRWF